MCAFLCNALTVLAKNSDLFVPSKNTVLFRYTVLHIAKKINQSIDIFQANRIIVIQQGLQPKQTFKNLSTLVFQQGDSTLPADGPSTRDLRHCFQILV